MMHAGALAGGPTAGLHHLGRAIGYLKKYKWVAAGAYLCLLTVTGIGLIAPTVIRWVIDLGIVAGDRQWIIAGAVSLVALAVLRGLFSFAQGYLGEVTSQGIAFDFRNALYDKIQRLSFSYHDQAQTGQLMTRATSDVEVVRTFIGMGLLNLVNTVVMVIGMAVILVMMDWQLGLLALLTVPIIVAVTMRFSGRIRPLFMKVQEEVGKLNTLLQENLVGVRVVKAFAREPHAVAQFRQQNEALLNRNLDVARAFSTNAPLFSLVGNLGTLIILWFGGLSVISGRLTLGELVAFNTYLLMLVMPIRMLGFIVGMMTRASASAQRIFEILDVPMAIHDRPGAIPLPPIRGEVTFDKVSFRYLQGENVLCGISFQAEPGQVIALLGETGSGKSTIINLIPRFYDVTEGSVRIDGYDVREVTVESLRRQIGIVLQETSLFSGTIRDNIAYGSPNATLEDVIRAAKIARAHDFIMEFPKGYDTDVAERGVTLSGGQKQRIAIARALLLNPRILILDDSTSNVDFETEFLIQEALAELMKGRTSFVIAQRISTIRNADLILVLDNGEIVARGQHKELLETSPIYAQIYQLQLRDEEVRALRRTQPEPDLTPVGLRKMPDGMSAAADRRGRRR